jgi:hypothetical protein
MSMKNLNDAKGDRTRDLSACSAVRHSVPQTTVGIYFMYTMKWPRQNFGICQKKNCIQDEPAEHKLTFKEFFKKFRVR